MAGRLNLSKWYADCITDTGDALILYSAELRWRSHTIHYTGLLTHRPGAPTRTRVSLRRQAPPQLRDSAVHWHSQPWKMQAEWRDLGDPIHQSLLSTPEGSLDWHCLAPRSSVEFLLPGTDPIRGWGYVEHLQISIAPWHLPIQQLRWGRFVNAEDAILWIDWRGPETRQVVYYNGSPTSPAIIADHQIDLPYSTTLTLVPIATLREGPLGSTALAKLPHLDRIFPARILQVREHKWLSHATLCRPGRPDSTGLAIHEVVDWP